jgi:uncharacterized protein YcaQ
MEAINLSKQQARRFLLAYHGLLPPRNVSGKSGVLDYIRRVGCIQFDPLNIVGHNPELVLQSRIADFQPNMLRELLYEERALIDGWDKMMSIYLIEDWPFFNRLRIAAPRRFGKTHAAIDSVLSEVRRALRERGPLSSIDINFNQTVDWPWGPTRLARAALESMYNRGELIIHHKVHTRKVYDFASRHFPDDLLSAADPNPTEEAFHDWYVQRRIGSVGLLWGRSGEAWLSMFGIKSRERRAAINRLLEDGRLRKVKVDGISADFFIRSDDVVMIDRDELVDPTNHHAAILAPLDNLLWDRKYIEVLFNFRYRWEVYKPVSEREFGYYVLPILYGDNFVARFEPGRDKQSGSLVIKNWWWEPNVQPSEQMREAVYHCFQQFIAYLETETIHLDDTLAKQEGIEWLIPR